MSGTTWDVERLTESTRASVPMAAQTQVEVIEAERGRVVLRMPIEGNGNHIGTMYAGALFALAEFPGGTLFSTTFDVSRYYPIVKGVEIQFLRFAATDISVEASMTEEQVAAVAAAADEHGKANYDLELALTDTDGNVVAISTNHYQLRAHGT